MKNGPYEMIKAPDGYPGMKYRGRYAYEHHIVWWKKNGQIPKGKEIHHIDGNHRNNKISNLQLVGHTEHQVLHGKQRSEAAMTYCECAFCGKKLKKLRSYVRWKLKKNKNGIFCSRKCIGMAIGYKRNLL